MQVMDYHEAVFASDISSSAKLDALAISSFFNYKKDQMCWPSNKTLSQITGLGISTLSRCHKELVNAGLLEVWRRTDNSNMYRPIIPTNIEYTHKSGTYSEIEQRVYSNSGTNNEYNNETNNEVNNEKNKENVSNETLILSTEVKAEESSAINNISFDDMFYKFERITDEERNHAAAAPAGSGYRSGRSGNSTPRRYDIDDAELTAFNQELADIRANEW